MLLLASWDCTRKRDAGRTIDGNCMELYDSIRSKFSIAFMYLVSSPCKFDEKVPALLKTLKAYIDSVLIVLFAS